MNGRNMYCPRPESPPLQQTNNSVVLPGVPAPLLIVCATSPEEETTVLGQVIVNLIGEGREEHCG